MMHAVVMAGGSGTRFWPLSRKAHPKQLLPLWGGKTLLELTVKRLEAIVPPEQIWIVTGQKIADPIRKVLEHFPEQNILVEPCPRNTLPCVALAAAAIERVDPAATLGLFSADHFIDDTSAFKECCEIGDAAAQRGQIATIGIRPTRPETGYGYIRFHPDDAPALSVEAFVEKPDLAHAKRYLDAGNYLWNAGIFFLSITKLRKEIERQLPEMASTLANLTKAMGSGQAEQVDRLFTKMTAVSIDYGVMEGATDVVVVPATFSWHDVGHWGALDQVLPVDDHKNVCLGETVTVDSQNSVVISHGGDGKVVAVVGLNGIVVVDTPTATLVLPVEEAQRVREVVAALQSQGRDDVT